MWKVNYEYVDWEVFWVVTCWYWTTSQVYTADCLINIPLSAIAAANREVMRILQASNPKVKHIKEWGAYRKYSAKERTMFQETKIVLGTISWLELIPPWCRPDIDRQCWHDAIGNSVRLWCLSSIFLYTYTKFTWHNWK